VALWIFMKMAFSHGGSFGHSRVAILDAIDRFGSLSASARAVGLTYQAVWNAVRLLNREFPEPLVTIRRSGRSSGAVLTPMGKEIVARFREIDSLVNVLLEKQFRALELAVGDDPKALPPIQRWAYLVDPSSVEPQKKQPTRRKKAKPRSRRSLPRSKSSRSSKSP
jgi:molybdate transport system regulatory protein